MRIKDITSYLESFAPPAYQEHYDNSGLLVGSPEWPVSGVLVALDCTEAVLDEAIAKKCNLIVAHHPIVFKGLKKITGKNYVERTIIKAIKADTAIYAIHTNVDNVYAGVSGRMAERLGLENLKVLSPKPDTLTHLISFAPEDHVEKIMDSLYNAGAGNIGKYKECSFQSVGTGTFMPSQEAKPYVGTPNKREKVKEVRFEVILPRHLERDVLAALRRAHPYEEIAYYLTPLQNENPEVGPGMVGEFSKPMDLNAFLQHLKEKMQTDCIKHTPSTNRPIKKVALCGGSGSAFLPHAIAHGADAYVSGDFKYHDFFEADGKIVIADIGHYESEQFTKSLLKDILDKKFSTFAVILSETVTNPVSYF